MSEIIFTKAVVTTLPKCDFDHITRVVVYLHAIKQRKLWSLNGQNLDFESYFINRDSMTKPNDHAYNVSYRILHIV